MAFSRGDTFHYGPSNSTRHLHIVICDSGSPQEPIIAVSVNTVAGWTDTTLLLQVGDHPFITRTSAVSYNRVDTFPVVILLAADVASQCHPPGFRNFDHASPMSPELLQKITDGALASPLTPRNMKRAIKQRLGIP